MSSLTEIGKGVYGVRYAFSGAIPFSGPQLDSLKWGDSIRDNNGKGMIMYVNTCCVCEKNYLAGTLILVASECTACYKNEIIRNLKEREGWEYGY